VGETQREYRKQGGHTCAPHKQAEEKKTTCRPRPRRALGSEFRNSPRPLAGSDARACVGRDGLYLKPRCLEKSPRPTAIQSLNCIRRRSVINPAKLGCRLSLSHARGLLPRPQVCPAVSAPRFREADGTLVCVCLLGQNGMFRQFDGIARDVEKTHPD
jgi:hypothetical protein